MVTRRVTHIISEGDEDRHWLVYDDVKLHDAFSDVLRETGGDEDEFIIYQVSKTLYPRQRIVFEEKDD